MKGFKDFDIRKADEGMRKNTFKPDFYYINQDKHQSKREPGALPSVFRSLKWVLIQDWGRSETLPFSGLNHCQYKIHNYLPCD